MSSTTCFTSSHSKSMNAWLYTCNCIHLFRSTWSVWISNLRASAELRVFSLIRQRINGSILTLGTNQWLENTDSILDTSTHKQTESDLDTYRWAISIIISLLGCDWPLPDGVMEEWPDVYQETANQCSSSCRHTMPQHHDLGSKTFINITGYKPRVKQ